MSATIYGSSDVAKHLGISNAVLSTWKKRHEVPEPDFVTPGGREFWKSLDGWDTFIADRRASEIERLEKRLEEAEALKERLEALKSEDAA